MIRRFLAFALVSGMGLTLDVAIYWSLCHEGVRPGLANLVSAGCGVTFVFFAASRKVFTSERDGWLVGPFAAYVAYQVVAIGLASLAVDGLDRLYDGHYLLAKGTILPVTLAVNFLVTQRLLTPAAQRRREAPPLHA